MSDGMPSPRPTEPFIWLLKVLPDQLDAAWAIAEPWLAASCERNPGDLTTEALRRTIDAGEAMLLLIQPDGRTPVAAGVMEVRDYQDGRRVLWIQAVGGSDRHACVKVLPLIEDGARKQGCHTVEFAGRPGWAALLPDYRVQAQYTKDLA